MIKYIFKDSPVTIKGAKKANPQKIGEELSKIADAGSGELKPLAVVEYARNPKSSLHKHFTWDDKEAADAYRLDQARELIRVIRVEIDDAEPVRAFLSISDGKTSYRSTQDVMASTHLQSLVLKQADRDLAAWQARYADLGAICDDVKAARQKIAKRMESGAAAH